MRTRYMRVIKFWRLVFEVKRKKCAHCALKDYCMWFIDPTSKDGYMYSHVTGRYHLCVGASKCMSINYCYSSSLYSLFSELS